MLQIRSYELRGALAVVVVLAALPLALALRGVHGPQCTVHPTRAIIKNIEAALETYRMDSDDTCPRDLEALYVRKILTRIPRDAWGRPFVFRCPGVHNKQSSDLLSKGPDGAEGTGDDIKNW